MTQQSVPKGSRVKRALKSIQERLAGLAAGRRGLSGITVASFLETTIIPVPIEIIIAPIMAASRARGFIIATVTLIGSVAGALSLYLLAWTLFDDLAQPLIDVMGWQGKFDSLEAKFEEGGFWVVFAISITPVPMQIAALAAGAASYPVWLFLIAIMLSRALRYYGLWLLVLGFGAGISRIFAGEKPKLNPDTPR
ncbi:YqaA family protein [Thalassospira lucentensis]|uniref:YqaA family protein n=1 Tax=Thalassospira lucentensis TaxID=168935 RepID=UPI003D2EF2DF